MELLILFIFVFVLRVLFLWAGATDSWLVWYNIANQTGPWLKHEAYNSCIEGYVGSPKLQYFLVSKFPHKYQAVAGNFLNIAYDFAGMVVIYLLSYHLIQGDLSREAAFLATTVYATAPILMPPTARLTGIKARTLGGLLALGYFLCLAGALLYDWHVLYVFCGLFAILSVLASAFAMQVVFLFSTCLSLFYLSPAPFLAALVPVAIAYFIPGLGVRETVRHKINHYAWYFDSYTGTTAGNRNNFSKFKKEIFVHRRYNELLYHIFMTQSFLIAIYTMPLFFFLAYCIAVNGALPLLVAAGPIFEFSLYVIAASIVVFFAVSTRYLLFLGEAERYFEFSVPFACLLVAQLVGTGAVSPMEVTALVLLQLSVVCATLFFKYRFEYQKSFKAWEVDAYDTDLLTMLGDIPRETKNILVIPTKYAFKLASLTPKDLGLKYFLYFVSKQLDGFRYIKNAMEHYESLEFNFDYLTKLFGINVIVLVNEYEKSLPAATREHLEQAYIIGKNDRYTVYGQKSLQDC